MSEYTKEQQKVIDCFGKNMLVSASAGSGKTKVLIAKIIKILLEDKAKVKDLLVVTFTNAACAEIKERLSKAIIDSNNENLFEQLDDLSVCDILTFDAFCKKVIEEFGYQIGISANFGVADGSFSAFLKSKSLDFLISKYYQENDDKFLSVLNVFFQKRNDKIFKEAIANLHNYIVNHHDFDFYKNLLEETYTDNINNSKAVEYLNKKFEEEKQYFCENLQKLLFDAQMMKDEKLCDNIQYLLDLLGGFKSDYFENLKYYFESFSPKRIGESKKDLAEIVDIKRRLKELTANFKENALDIFPADLKNIDENHLNLCLKNDKKVLENMIEIARDFEEKYQTEKAKYQVLDFVDLEKYALQILQEESIKNALQKKYKYIFVDEYQDTSKLQNDIIDLIENGKNLMMVGDVKQSIYRYRNAEPQIFINKYDDFQTKKDTKLFELNKNFRSEKKILKFSNLIFDVIMQKDVDGIDYKNTSNLIFGETIPTYENENFVDVVVIDKKKTEKEKSKFEYYSVKNAELEFDENKDIENEALFVANQIVEFVKTKKIWNGDKECFENISFGDIAILTRDKKNVILKVQNILRKFGIPVKCSFDDDLLQNVDIQILMSVLRLIQNFQDDKSLLIVMSSVVGNFDFDEISQIKMFDRKSEFFHQAVKNYQTNNNDEISKKISNLMQKLENYKIASNNKDICELILHIVKMEKFENYFWINGCGKQFDEHLNLLLANCNSIKNYSLSEFVNYIDTFGKQVVTNQISDDEDAVTISTIHASKGLEYPVVFLLECGKNIRLLPNSVCFDEEFGLTKQSVDVESRTKFENHILSAYKLKNIEDEKKDEKRLLYVALTRAKNHLTVVGTKNVDNLQCYASNFELKNTKSYLDWIFSTLNQNQIDSFRQNKRLKQTFDDVTINFKIFGKEDFEQPKFEKKSNKNTSNEDYEDFEKIINKKFFHSPLSKKTSVSQIMSEEEHYNISNFLATQSDKTSDDDFLMIGTTYHKIMQFLNFEKSSQSVKEQIESLIEKDVIMSQELQIVDTKKIETAFETIKKLISTGDKILKEQQFLCHMPAKELINTTENYKILIQGVADLILIKNDEIYLVDYKTSRMNDERQFKQKYSTQLSIYAKAIEDFYQKPVTKKLIYSFYLDKLISI